MATKKSRPGFIAVNLIKGGDMTLFNRLKQETESDPELDQSKIIRLALKEYFEKLDNA